MAKKIEKLKLVCKSCGVEKEFTEQELKDYHNWKCDKCYAINMIGTGPKFVWKCATGTPRRRPTKR